jgi:hypothetical protein
MYVALLLSTLPPSWQQPKGAEQQQAAQASIDLVLYRKLFGTLGFCLGQELSLTEIARQHETLAPRVALLRAQFDVVFGTARKRVEQRLAEMAGPSWKELDEQLRDELKKRFGGGTLTTEESLAFLDKVGERIKGKFESPFIETLLSNHPTYLAMPAQELVDGFKRVYETKGNAKAKGLNVRITVPLSWALSEGERPNIVQKFKSEGGHGRDEVLILIKNMPLPDGFAWKKEDLEETFAPENLVEFVPDGATAIKTKSIVLDGQPAGLLTYEQIIQRLDQKLFLREELFVTAYGNHLLMLQGINGGMLDEQDAVRERFKKLQPTYSLIANSLVLMDQYTK